MIRLNCKRMTRIMPLYVAGDLSAARQQKAAHHLTTCEACRKLADEFGESRSFLAEGSSLPEFGADFYAEIRNTVLDKIAVERSLPKRTIFSRRWVYATSLAVVIIAAGLVLQYLRHPLIKGPDSLAFTPPMVGPASLAVTQEDSQSSRQFSKHAQPLRQNRLAIADLRRRQFQLKTIEKNRQTDRSNELAQVKRVANSVTPVEGPAPSTSAEATQISRIEIQTADPNIRIIWFGPQGHEEGEQPTHDQIKQENRK